MTAQALKAELSRLSDAIHAENRPGLARDLYRARFRAKMELDRILDADD